MEQLQQVLNQLMPWGLTVGQTGLILVVAAGLVIAWTFLGLTLRLAGTIIRVGCALIGVLACGCITAFILYNVSTGGLR